MAKGLWVLANQARQTIYSWSETEQGSHQRSPRFDGWRRNSNPETLDHRYWWSLRSSQIPRQIVPWKGWASCSHSSSREIHEKIRRIHRPNVRIIHRGWKRSVFHKIKGKLGVVEILSMLVISDYVNRRRLRIPAYMNVFNAMVVRTVNRTYGLSTPAPMKMTNGTNCPNILYGV